jgi:hypothetical protein
MTHPLGSPTPHLFLRVSGGAPRVVALREGVSVGRDPNNTIVIDHPDVLPIHATVWGFDGEFRLECAADGVVLLADGAEASRLMLINGTRCRIGDAVLTCTENASVDADEESACVRCGHDLTRLPVSPRFCPRCGLNVSVRPVPVAHAPGLVQEAPRDPGTSTIVVGYGIAMNKLGGRYEIGQGVHRNVDEAVRCYGKAARLGNEDAKSRLEQRGGD